MWERLSEALVVMAVGLGAVFSSLLFFYLMMIVLQYIDSKFNLYMVNKKLNPVSEPKDDKEVAITPEIVAVISAAAYEVFKKPIVVKKIKYLTKTETSWSQTGRMIVMGSHNIEKK